MTDSVAAAASVPTTSLGSVNTNAPAQQALASLRQTEAALTGVNLRLNSLDAEAGNLSFEMKASTLHGWLTTMTQGNQTG